jgi:hypothetical protein
MSASLIWLAAALAASLAATVTAADLAWRLVTMPSRILLAAAAATLVVLWSAILYLFGVF